ncbi:PAS domain-containing protein [Gracilibacillus caseinilyticus]|uniref:PAS domain-containing protein n=1 Tax=Gracilibacillus caseinilyticus TaxID=2932256 RepID=A0ABY4F3G7_9BACI|nr:STAS domain-containing protein [Gracilibacillus caseinilyticus]UOQ50429.1 PAS domain-containing protein [Gracilibacillus caseinilyticus]
MKQILFEKALNRTKVGVVITDPDQQDNPIIFANEGFYKLTGYRSEEVIGQNCRFLQGPDTNRNSVKKISEALHNRKSIEILLYNYKKNQTGFWNELIIDPLWIEEESKFYFIGIQKDISEEREKTIILEETLKEMDSISTPIVPITDNAVILPLIGNFTDKRFESMSNRLSFYLEDSDEDYLIIDLSGLYEMDTYVVSRFFEISQLARLMGKETLLAGIGPNLAMKTAGLVDTVNKIPTFNNVKAAVKYISE